MSESRSVKQDYIEYVSQVLGVKSILNDLQSSSTTQQVPLLVCIERYATYDQNEKELLFKMISALKIDQKNIVLIDLEDINNYQAQFYVYFIDQQQQKNSTEDNLVQTYSPRFLLKNSEFKKNAWNDLQKVIAFFNRPT